MKPLTFTDLVMRAARIKTEENRDKRTPVKIRVKRIEAGNNTKTPERKSKEVKRLKRNITLSPGQKKIEAFFHKQSKVGGTGLSRETINTKLNKQGAGNSPLQGVQNCGASTPKSRGSKPLPVVRGGGSVRGKNSKIKLLERWPHERKPPEDPPPEDLGLSREDSKQEGTKRKDLKEV